MIKESLKGYRPDWVAPPGDTIKENLEVLGMTQSELAKRMGMAKENVNEILNGKSTITPETALKFELVLNMSADFILKLENSYRIYLAEKLIKEKQEKEKAFIKNIPYKQMIEYGWINERNSKENVIQELKQYLGVDSFSNLNKVYAFYRKSKIINENKYAVIAWLRKGELEAQQMNIPPYSKTKLKHNIKNIIKLTNESFGIIKNELTSELADCGVALSYVPCLKGAPVYGAVKWLKPDKPFITMSLRYKTNDQFWFTLFHEIYHVLNPKKTSVIIDDNSNDDDYEKKANKFASKTLIPDKTYRQFVTKGKFDKSDIIMLSQKAGIAPGIVVGRLQYDGYIHHSKLNELKIKYEIGDL